MSCIVPILPSDLYSYESYDRLIEALAYLEKTFNDTMDSVSESVKSSRERVDNLSERIKKAKSKVDGVEGSNRALSINSAPEFPKIPLKDDELLPVQQYMPKYHPKVHETQNPGLPPYGSVYDIRTLNAMYQSVQIPTPSLLDQDQPHDEIGLGEMPQLSNLTSLILFNSTENPYKVDLTQIKTKKASEAFSDQRSDSLPEAPISLLEDKGLMYQEKELDFKSTDQDGPQMEMPQQLNIPGIANLNWEEDLDSEDFSTGLSIAPSKYQGALPSLSGLQDSLPQLPKTEEALPKIPKQDKLPSVPKAQKPAEPSKPAEKPTQQTPPTPPPLPPKANPPKPPPLPKNENPPAPPKDVPPQVLSNDRTKLLSDLRTENPLARLKKVTTEEKKPQQEVKKDPFQELKEKIATRFKDLHAPPVTNKPKSSGIGQTGTYAMGGDDSGSDWSDD